ncbi:MAG TPA: Crp/Fnr family transcriptional regulator [Candidatus Acidoferrum sp.]
MAESEKRIFTKRLPLAIRLVTSSRQELALGNPVALARRKSAPVDKKNVPFAADKKRLTAGWETFLTGISKGKTVLEFHAKRNIFVQGDLAESMFFLDRGKVKLAVTSFEGKEAIVATLGSGEFFGEGCLAGQPLRMATAISVEDCTLTRVEKPVMARMLHEHIGLAEMFVTHLLSRNIRYEADLVDQFFNSSEVRLARMLLLLSHFGNESKTESVVPGISQEHLAEMVGTTRSRINFFMNKFRKLGFIDYNSREMTVHKGLLKVVRHPAKGDSYDE